MASLGCAVEQEKCVRASALWHRGALSAQGTGSLGARHGSGSSDTSDVGDVGRSGSGGGSGSSLRPPLRSLAVTPPTCCAPSVWLQCSKLTPCPHSYPPTHPTCSPASRPSGARKHVPPSIHRCNHGYSGLNPCRMRYRTPSDAQKREGVASWKQMQRVESQLRP